MYHLLADIVVVIHLAFIIFVIAGGLLLFRRPRLAWLHLPAAAWGALVEIMGWPCPLTPLENRFRELGGGTSYEGDFIAHYLLPIIYPENLTATIQLVLGVVVIVVNGVIYMRVIRTRRQGSKAEP